MSRRRLTFEVLERRQVLAAFAMPWPEPSDMTLSFAPDGTRAGELTTSLFDSFSRLPTRAWQEEVLRAFQTWAVESNINVRLVADGGQPFDTLGLKQGDPRFGDIRIGAVPLAPDVLAVADPYDPFVANTWVGDVFLNNRFSFDTGGAAGTYDLFSVMLHEVGHVFGVGHSADPLSPMFQNFERVATGLTPGDVAQLQALFGPRLADRWEGLTGNDTVEHAMPIALTDAKGLPAMAEFDADLGRGDRDVYRVTLPTGISTLAVRMEASERGMLVSRVRVLDADGRVVATGTANGPQDNNVLLALDGLESGATYFVQIDAGRDDVFGIGSYRLELDPELEREAGYASVNEEVPFAPTEERLMATTPGYVEHTYYEMYDSFTAVTPSHSYRVRSADLGPEMTNVMTVVVDWESDATYEVTIRDDAGQLLEPITVFDGAGHLELQLPSVLSNRDYLIDVRGDVDEPLEPDDQFGFEVTVDFDQDGEHLLPLINDQLSPGQFEFRSSLTIAQSQDFHYVLSGSDWNASAETGLRLTILDAEGEAVASSAVVDGASRGSDAFLEHGTYTLVFSRDSSTADTPLLFQLSGISLSSPLGPQLRDTVHAPVNRSSVAVQQKLEFYWGTASPLSSAPATLAATLPASGGPSGTPIPRLLESSTQEAFYNETFARTRTAEGAAINSAPAPSSRSVPKTWAVAEIGEQQPIGRIAAAHRPSDREMLVSYRRSHSEAADSAATEFESADGHETWASQGTASHIVAQPAVEAVPADDRGSSAAWRYAEYAALILQAGWLGLAWLFWPKRRTDDCPRGLRFRAVRQIELIELRSSDLGRGS